MPRKKKARKDSSSSESEAEEVESYAKKRSSRSIPSKMSTLQQTSKIVSKASQVLKAVGNSRKMLGVHVSAAGGPDKAIHNALEMGCRSLALFMRNQRRWDAKPMGDEVVQAWNKAIKETGFSLNQILPHGSYLMNPGSPDSAMLKKTREAMLDECKRCERLGITLYNFHPGSTLNKCSIEECLSKVAETIDYIHENTDYITLVTETMAGAGNTVGGKFSELRRIIGHVEKKDRVGVCIDTCHIFVAGYDIRTKEEYDETMKKFEEEVGFQYLRAVHLNDSKSWLVFMPGSTRKHW